jgi:hypothetical protein
MTIGIAIPTYSGHLYNLKDLLYQISKSTILPSQVSVSISSFDGDLELSDYPFELIITKSSEFRNVSQNCNIAASKLTTDIISFFGGDDLPHIKRNEYIIKAFESGCNSVVHNYINSRKNVKEFTDDIGEIQLFIDYIDTYTSDKSYPISSKEPLICYANGPISISKEIFNKFKYNESSSFFKTEDTIYNSNLVKNGYNISYIKNNLMLYIH